MAVEGGTGIFSGDYSGDTPGTIGYTAPFRYFGDADKEYYETNPGQGYQQFTSALFGNSNTPLNQYASNQYGRLFAQYLQASEQNDQTHWVDYLTPEHANQIYQAFQLETPSTKGYQLAWNPAGRTA